MKIDDPMMNAVLDADDSFRVATLREVRALARRRRRGRTVRRVLAVGGAIACAAILLYPRPAQISAPASAENFAGIDSAPLSPNAVVHTREGLFTLVKRPSDGWHLVATTSAGIDVFETRERMSQPAFLDDGQLFSAFPGRRVAIVDPGTAEARLIVY